MSAQWFCTPCWLQECKAARLALYPECACCATHAARPALAGSVPALTETETP